MKRIPLTQGKFALTNNKDHYYLNQWKWHYSHGYAMRSTREGGKKHNIYMHRCLITCSEGFQIDHITGNRLDNCRSNLRLVTSQQNKMNSKKRNKTSSIYKGVTKHKYGWIAQIRFNNRHYYLGFYKKEIDAARAYNIQARIFFREFARLNEV